MVDINPTTPLNGMQCNFGGFIPLTTVDWPGLAASILFLRGCPNLCGDCHNRNLLSEGKTVQMQEVLDEIKCASPYVSALIVSGGEPTKHQDELEIILKYAKGLGLLTRIQTSGIHPYAVCELIDQRLLDSIALDIKVELNSSDKISPKFIPKSNVAGTLGMCETAIVQGRLKEFEVVHTIFPYDGYEEQLKKISNQVMVGTPFVLQQGVPRDHSINPLSRDQLWNLAKKNIRQSNVRIRSRTGGEEKVL